MESMILSLYPTTRFSRRQAGLKLASNDRKMRITRSENRKNRDFDSGENQIVRKLEQRRTETGILCPKQYPDWDRYRPCHTTLTITIPATAERKRSVESGGSCKTWDPTLCDCHQKLELPGLGLQGHNRSRERLLIGESFSARGWGEKAPRAASPAALADLSRILTRTTGITCAEMQAGGQVWPSNAPRDSAPKFIGNSCVRC